ncbi:hypothetical protein HPB52_004414 [Rhipicephalus sanguineus]|uniref:Uncharacterized protein n=1 Tax=Rhipicephalus sanguineus TaxID=34632 RepID=A0A9D4PDD4_RHISA|nr:hypothetical protein HPB52_004414 [Rhipicephalus sanguineus]
MIDLARTNPDIAIGKYAALLDVTRSERTDIGQTLLQTLAPPLSPWCCLEACTSDSDIPTGGTNISEIRRTTCPPMKRTSRRQQIHLSHKCLIENFGQQQPTIDAELQHSGIGQRSTCTTDHKGNENAHTLNEKTSDKISPYVCRDHNDLVIKFDRCSNNVSECGDG